MGKKRTSNGTSKKGSGYEHNHTHNPKAHNSDERRLEVLKNIQISRLTKIVERLKTNLSNYVPEFEKNKIQKKGWYFIHFRI